MKKYILSLVFAGSVGFYPLHAQYDPCILDIYPMGWPNTFPYYCTGDTLAFMFYSPGIYSQYDSLIIHWGDGSVSGISTNNFQTSTIHVYQQPGTYFPFIEALGGTCGDTLLPFQVYGDVNPGDTLQYGIINYIVVSDGCIQQSGRAYIDADGNCSYSASDVPLAGKSVLVYNGNNVIGLVFTNQDGQFAFNGPTGVTFKMQNYQLGTALTPTCGTVTSGSETTANNDNDFVFNCNSGLDLTITSGSTFLAQTMFSPIFFNVCNEGCTAVPNPTVTFQFPSQVIPENPGSVNIYLGGGWSQFIPTFSGSTVTFTIPTILTPQSCVLGYLKAQANPQNTVLGTEVCVTFSVEPSSGDVNPSNNSSTTCMTVVTSYDPNDKQGQCDNKNAHGEIEANKPLIYTIRFQNEGNFPARDIRITDTLDVHLDWNSVEVLGYSHPVQVWMTDNVLTFFFDDIWLPTISMNEAASQGFVVFQVKQDPNLPPLTQIKNNADIFFDYNPPVRTNTVVSVIKSVGMVDNEGLNVTLVPNPATDYVNIVGEIGAPCEIRLIDGAGRTVLTQLVSNAGQAVNLKELRNGVYTAQIREADKIKGVQKVVVLR
ncbi:MAG: T9SS type A sorting domain-containing protein [Flavobacteriales bacterium]|nr:T9SS type A sorting domain-containing protein [Flavobacteriales bacterium]MDW8409781.1 T9SS type A sorting domain-containing protein [Flavobacteriales bacterium]